MYPTVHFALLGFIPVSLTLFVLLPVRRAIVATFLLGWLFLPVAGYELVGLPEYDKFSAISYVTLLGTLVSRAMGSGDHPPIRGVGKLDLPIVIFCLGAGATSISNGLGAYNAMSAAAKLLLYWGIPYFIGKTYFGDWLNIRRLAIGLVIGGLIYVPFCLFEIRFSPQLHKLLYGYHPFAFGTTRRLGGFRPMVFTQNGLALGLWMAAASACAIWLVRQRGARP